ncbi:hypothetical protein PR202_ga12587 [Eleusine coracana subsp. coracana]|uniref:Cytokinin riboside 5'-monophosphate phosphoribohydrolase n=1 Tax=Eleusine coracana subsp. coracana TaxID=191504 RepID=A0AAV5CCJ1_ELECO|nr:hypothetical protein PR202_ga12587 [Eleusine coracana subsp. coracana]
MEAAASSVGSGFASQLRPSLGLRDGRRFSPRPPPPPRSWLRPPRPAVRGLCGEGGRTRGAITTATSRDQLGELQADAVGSAALEPGRSSPVEVREEMARCFDLVHRLGRGAVYLGSSRIARLLNCTTWTGAGPGLMDAAIQGALEAEKPVGGFKISKEAGEWTTSNFHPYLPPETYLTCRYLNFLMLQNDIELVVLQTWRSLSAMLNFRFFSARKHGLVDAAVRSSHTDRTAVVALPGGIGTLDELFEIMALIQLERIGSTLPVPFLLLNYDSYYSKLLDFLSDCQEWGTVCPRGGGIALESLQW